MDSAPGANLPPSSSLDANYSQGPVETGRPRPDGRMWLSFESLNLRGSATTSRGPTAGRDPAAAGTRPAFGLLGGTKAYSGESAVVAPASSAGLALAAGRGRARTLPAWMTGGESNAAVVVPGGLQEQQPVGSGGTAGVSQASAGLNWPRPQVESGAMAGVSQGGGAGFYSSRLHVSTHAGQPSAPHRETSGQQTKKKNNKNKAKNRDRYDCKHHGADTSSYYGGGMDGPGGPSGISAMGGQSSSSTTSSSIRFATAQTVNWQNSPPPPGTGISFTGPPRPPTSAPNGPLPAKGRGMERTRPAWMTAGATAAPGGLQQQAPFVGSSTTTPATKPRQAGMYSSRPPPSTHGAPQDSGWDDDADMATAESSSGSSGQHNQMSQGFTLRLGRGASGGGAAWPTLSRRKGVSIVRHAAGQQNTPATAAGVHVSGAGIPARTLFSGAPTAAAPPFGFQQQPAAAGTGLSWMPQPALRLFTSAPQQSAPSSAPLGQQAGSHTGVLAKAANNGNGTKRSLGADEGANPQSERSAATAGADRSSSRHDAGAMVIHGQNPPAPAARAASSVAPSQGRLRRRFAFQHLEGAVPEALQVSGQLSGPKRDRDEEDVVLRLRIAPPGIFSGAPGQGPANSWGASSLVGGTGGAGGQGPSAKKTRATVVKETKSTPSPPSPPSPSKERVATRARFKILHHHAIPNQGQTGIGGKTPPASNIVCNQYGTAKGKRVYGSAPQRASLSSTPTSASNGEPASPPFVVIDGNNAGVLLQDAGGGWSVRGALLAIQYFEQRGVPGVVYLSRDHVNSVTPQDAFYAEFEKARTNGTVAEVPPKAKSSQYILQQAVERKAHIVTNQRPDAQGKHLAALGLKKEELRAYLSLHLVGYTFARNEFAPDPRAPLIKMLTREASATWRGKVVIVQH